MNVAFPEAGGPLATGQKDFLKQPLAGPEVDSADTRGKHLRGLGGADDSRRWWLGWSWLSVAADGGEDSGARLRGNGRVSSQDEPDGIYRGW